MRHINIEQLHLLAKTHFNIATHRGADTPLGIALQMGDGEILSWDNLRSDEKEGDEMAAAPLHALLEGYHIESTEDLAPSQEVVAVVVCTEHPITTAFKDALAGYIGMPDGIKISVIAPVQNSVAEFKL